LNRTPECSLWCHRVTQVLYASCPELRCQSIQFSTVQQPPLIVVGSAETRASTTGDEPLNHISDDSCKEYGGKEEEEEEEEDFASFEEEDEETMPNDLENMSKTFGVKVVRRKLKTKRLVQGRVRVVGNLVDDGATENDDDGAILNA
jgi:hypothetical protein